eukprot:scpid66790/ scgid1596/ 
MTFPEPCFIPAGRQPSCRSCLSVTLWLAMATALVTVFTPLGHCATLIPDVCNATNGTNPVEYQEIYTAGTQIDAESSLGSKLVDPDCELVRIYTTLQVNNRTYAPGAYFPGDDFEPAYTLEQNGSALSLAFVYGRNSQYAETFLSIPVPTRYYSFGTLHAKDAWKADDHQTLKFTIRSDWQSQRCWDVSSTDQRLSFLTHVVNTTLTKCRSRVTQDWQEQEGWLSGNIYVRTPSNQRPDFTFTTFVYGYVHKYRKCENHYTPEELSFHTGRGAFPLDFAVCSEWAELEVHSLALYCLILGVVGLWTFIVVIFFGKLVDGPHLEDVLKARKRLEELRKERSDLKKRIEASTGSSDEEVRKERSRMEETVKKINRIEEDREERSRMFTRFTSITSLFAIISGHYTAAPGRFYPGFPPMLSIAQLCEDSEEHTWSSNPLMRITAKWLHSVEIRSYAYGFLSFLALFLPFLSLPLAGQNHQYDTIRPLVFCHSGAYNTFTLMIFSSLGLLPWLIAALVFTRQHNKQQEKQKTHSEKIQASCEARTCSVILVFFFLCVSFIAFFKIMLFVTFTTIGSVLYHTFIFFGVLAIVKVI